MLKRAFVWFCFCVVALSAYAGQPVLHIEFESSQLVVDVTGKNAMSFNDDKLVVECDGRSHMEFSDVVSLHYYDSSDQVVATDLRRPHIHVNTDIDEITVDGVRGLSVMVMNSKGGLLSYSEDSSLATQKVEFPGMRGGYKLRIGNEEYKIVRE